MGWNEAARSDRERVWSSTIEQKKVTYDFDRLMEGATKVKTSEFAVTLSKTWTRAVLTGRDRKACHENSGSRSHASPRYYRVFSYEFDR